MIYYGADYYPEHWPEDRWAQDARLMQQAGFNVVRLAEFAWSQMEPAPGRYDFAWLDRAIDVLAAHGIRVVLGTPTASPPPWLMHNRPELFLVREDNSRATYGGRREYCPTHPLYRTHARQIAQAMAEHYHANPNVIGWQIDNEFGDRCYCENCRAAFQDWLRARYRTLDVLNRCWGTVFWSHEYTAWEQIPVPLANAVISNPGLDLDYRRFISATYVSLQQEQIAILRQRCPDQFITHNFMGFKYDKLDYFDLAEPLDLVTWDNYPRGFWSNEAAPPALLALSHATMRGLKRQNFWVMESQSGITGWQTMGAAPRPGEIRLWAYQAIAHGADGIVFFRWRTARFGAEQFWHGILDHDGQPRRRYAEVAALGSELQRIAAALEATETRTEVAMLLSYDSRFAFQIQPNNPDFDYATHLYDYYAALHRQHIAVDIVGPHADLSGYRMLIVPALYILPDNLAEKLEAFVEGGGTVVLTTRSGVKDFHNTVVDRPLPGLLSTLCGATVDEYDSLYQGSSIPIQAAGNSGITGAATVWCDILVPETAEVLATYGSDFYMGRPAITLNRYGKGRAFYVGTVGDRRLVDSVVRYVLSALNIRPPLKAPEDVEIALRWQADQPLIFALNHSSDTREVALEQPYVDLITDQPVGPVLTLPPKGVAILAPGETRS
ncbi:MAG: beta-galactosidase [Anaerolineae bacterium]|nr:beta-galactosidase [Anaerolineae bacterium]